MIKILLRYYCIVTLLIFYAIGESVRGADGSDGFDGQGKDPNMYYNRMINILGNSRKIARKFGENRMLPIHVFSGIVESDYGSNLLKENGVNLRSLKNFINVAMEHGNEGKTPLDNKSKVINSEELTEVLTAAEKLVSKYGGKKVDVEHMLNALANDDLVSQIYEEAMITEDLLKEILKKKFQSKKDREKGDKSSKKGKFYVENFGTNLNEKIRKGKIPPLFGREEEIRAIIESLARLNKNSPVLVGHPGTGKTSIVEGLAYRIEKGDVPKFLQGYTIVSLNFRKFTAGTSYRGEFETRMQNMIKELKKKSKKLILFVDEIHLLLGAGKAEGGTDAANLLKPVLSKGEIKLIGATTLHEYRKYIESCTAFERRFEKILVQPPSVDATIKILRSLKDSYEKFYGVRITDKAIVASVKISDAFVKNRYQPDKSIDLLNKTCAYLQVQLAGKPRVIDVTERDIKRLVQEISTLEMDQEKVSKKKYFNLIKEVEQKKKDLQKYYEEFEVSEKRMKLKQDIEKKLTEIKDEIKSYFDKGEEPPEDLRIALRNAQDEYSNIYKETVKYVEEKGHNAMNVDSVFQEHVSYIYMRDSGMPIGSLCFESNHGVMRLYERLSQTIVGNEEVIKALSDAVVKLAAGMKDPDRPIGAFLFLGPTGVGKTELATALATELFGSRDNLIRINMSEFTEAHSVSKIVGSPPGYVGFAESGQLTEAVREKPHSVVLFDELEKAHADVFKVLLQILGDGYINDNHRRDIDFSNTIIVMTSNLGAELYKKKLFVEIDRAKTPEYKRAFKEVKKLIVRKCKKFFKPEFVNRIDKISVFEPLSRENLQRIVKLRFSKLEKRLEQKNIFLKVTESAINYIIEESFDPELGARPTLIFIESVIMTKLAVMYMKKELVDDMDVTIDYSTQTKNLVIHLANN